MDIQTEQEFVALCLALIEEEASLSAAERKLAIQVKSYLCTLGFTEIPPVAINTSVMGPQTMQFCGECQLGEHECDVVVRLHDTRLMTIECKVSNSALSSVRRLNNDAVVKAEYWSKQFGTALVVSAATLHGIFTVPNLEQAQARGLSLFWAHDLDKLGTFIGSTRGEELSSKA